mmetsp:Transcript_89997/g.278359  ORF Transcript_89997/g.278359 Transcript_89997/m.278359 type:complete len:202 (-) Transcript_89997:786-1391(-)
MPRSLRGALAGLVPDAASVHLAQGLAHAARSLRDRKQLGQGPRGRGLPDVGCGPWVIPQVLAALLPVLAPEVRHPVRHDEGSITLLPADVLACLDIVCRHDVYVAAEENDLAWQDLKVIGLRNLLRHQINLLHLCLRHGGAQALKAARRQQGCALGLRLRVRQQLGHGRHLRWARVEEVARGGAVAVGVIGYAHEPLPREP